MATVQQQSPFPSHWQFGQDFDPTTHLMQIERFDKRLNKKVSSDYLNVQNRLIWFIRDQRALIAAGMAQTSYTIQTELVEHDREACWAHFKTYVRDVLGNEATMYGSEAACDFPDYIEKASTKSLGRALLLLGYGTAFTSEIDEGERVVDAPVPPRANDRNDRAAAPASAPRPAPPAPARPTPAPVARPAPASAAEALATDRQITSIRKLCAALGRPEPDLATLTFAAAREHLTQLSQAYSEARQAS
jgi:hypothetical protein